MTGAGGHVALILPGGGIGPYTAPLLLPSIALEQVGARVEVVPYPPFRPESLEREAARAFDEHVLAEVTRILASADWSRVTFVAKSRGTMFLSVMPSDVVPCDDVEAIWVTPLLGLDYVRNGVVAKRWRSLVVAGGADPYHDEEAHHAVCREIGAAELVIADADHGLTVPADVRRTIDAYAALADASLAFVAR